VGMSGVSGGVSGCVSDGVPVGVSGGYGCVNCPNCGTLIQYNTLI
jgi:predicted RNA-binding Zn-ribbon protein involved in translation (DUF1610 family)